MEGASLPCGCADLGKKTLKEEGKKDEMKEPFPFPPLFAVDRQVLFGWRRLVRPTNPTVK
jgi:hypothetical protein